MNAIGAQIKLAITFTLHQCIVNLAGFLLSK